MFLEEGMIHEFFDTGPFIRILLQAAIEEVPYLSRHAQVRWYFYLILHYLYQFFLSGDLKGVLPHHHFVHHDADRPNIDLLIIFLSFEDFGADVEGSAAEGGPQFVVLVH